MNKKEIREIRNTIIVAIVIGVVSISWFWAGKSQDDCELEQAIIDSPEFSEFVNW